MGVHRPHQLSIVEGEERPVGPVLGSVFTGNNAQLMAAVAPLYLTGSVLDTTYGRGKWWDRYTPPRFEYHDIELDGVDFRDLPHDDASFDTVTFDPPYIPAGGVRRVNGGQTNDERDYRERFGLTVGVSLQDMNERNVAGLAECARVACQWVLVKCSDFVTGGRFTLGHLTMLDAARQLDLEVHDLIVHATGTGPGGHNIHEILRARRAHSYLLVFDATRSQAKVTDTETSPHDTASSPSSPLVPGSGDDPSSLVPPPTGTRAGDRGQDDPHLVPQKGTTPDLDLRTPQQAPDNLSKQKTGQSRTSTTLEVPTEGPR